MSTFTPIDIPWYDPPILTGQTVPFSMDLGPMLETGETLASATVTVTQAAGSRVVDSQASSRVTGAAVIAGTVVSQNVANCIGGVTYLLKFAGVTQTARPVVFYAYFYCQSVQ